MAKERKNLIQHQQTLLVAKACILAGAASMGKEAYSEELKNYNNFMKDYLDTLYQVRITDRNKAEQSFKPQLDKLKNTKSLKDLIGGKDKTLKKGEKVDNESEFNVTLQGGNKVPNTKNWGKV